MIDEKLKKYYGLEARKMRDEKLKIYNELETSEMRDDIRDEKLKKYYELEAREIKYEKFKKYYELETSEMRDDILKMYNELETSEMNIVELVDDYIIHVIRTEDYIPSYNITLFSKRDNNKFKRWCSIFDLSKVEMYLYLIEITKE